MSIVGYVEDINFQDDCSICLSTEDGKMIKIKRCDHLFHFDCLNEWSKKSMGCPLCKRTIDNSPERPLDCYDDDVMPELVFRDYDNYDLPELLFGNHDDDDDDDDDLPELEHFGDDFNENYLRYFEDRARAAEEDLIASQERLRVAREILRQAAEQERLRVARESLRDAEERRTYMNEMMDLIGYPSLITPLSHEAVHRSQGQDGAIVMPPLQIYWDTDSFNNVDQRLLTGSELESSINSLFTNYCRQEEENTFPATLFIDVDSLYLNFRTERGIINIKIALEILQKYFNHTLPFLSSLKSSPMQREIDQ